MGSVVGEMEKSQWYIGTPNEVVLCIDQVEEYRFTGRLYHAYSAAATVFLSMDEAVLLLKCGEGEKWRRKKYCVCNYLGASQCIMEMKR